MRKFVPFVALSIIFGVLISWGEGVLPLLNWGHFNAISFTFLSLLLSLLVVLLLVTFSGNFINALFSLVCYIIAYLGTKLYFGYPINLEVYVLSGILLVSGILASLLLYIGRHLLNRSSNKKWRIKKDIAMPVIFFLVSILFSAFVVLAEQRAMYPVLLNYFYSYLYFLVGVTLIIAVLSFSEVSGFLIGFFSIPIYFLMNRMIANNFDVLFLIYNEKNFFILVGLYSLLFAISTLIMGHTGKVFTNGIAISRMVRFNSDTAKKPLSGKSKNFTKGSSRIPNKSIVEEKSATNGKNGNSVIANVKKETENKNILKVRETERTDEKVGKKLGSKSN